MLRPRHGDGIIDDVGWLSDKGNKMNRDLVKRLAIQSGINLQFIDTGELFSFATAIAKQAVDEFKAGLVPVGYIHENGTEEFFLTKNCENCIPLYALGEIK